MTLNGANIAGGNPKNGRVNNDWYATNPETVKKLLNRECFKLKNILEPCVGAGHIANVLEELSGQTVTGIDVVDRGYKNTIITDFLSWQPDKDYDTIITNPPYSLASEFITKCMSILSDDGKLAMFLKIQFLEGINRKPLFDNYPPKYIYVFRKRTQVFNSGLEKNPSTGKPWNNTMCFAWYVWDKLCDCEPVIRWID